MTPTWSGVEGLTNGRGEPEEPDELRESAETPEPTELPRLTETAKPDVSLADPSELEAPCETLKVPLAVSSDFVPVLVFVPIAFLPLPDVMSKIVVTGGVVPGTVPVTVVSDTVSFSKTSLLVFEVAVGPDTDFFKTKALVLSSLNSSTEFLRLVVGLGATRTESTPLVEDAIVEETCEKTVACSKSTLLGLVSISIAALMPVLFLVATGVPVTYTKGLPLVSLKGLTSFVDSKRAVLGST